MSFYGAGTFEKNVRTLLKTKQFKSGNFAEKADLCYRLFNSKYGARNILGPKELKYKGDSNG